MTNKGNTKTRTVKVSVRNDGRLVQTSVANLARRTLRPAVVERVTAPAPQKPPKPPRPVGFIRRILGKIMRRR